VQGRSVTSENWYNLPPGDKIKMIGDVITLYRLKENAAIMQDAEFYVTRLDDALRTETFPKELPLPTLVRLLAIMEYDFYNGQNKDDLAKEFLGEPLYQSIKARRQNPALE